MPNRSAVAGPAPRPRRHAAGVLLAAGLLAIAGLACGSGGKSKGQTQPPPEVPPILSGVGTPTGDAVAAPIGPEGGVIASVDALLEVTVPAGALERPVELSIQPVTPTAIGAVGGAYRIRPEGVRLAKPVTILLHGPATYAAGTSIDDLGIGYQDASGFWFRVKGVKRDAAANTLSVESNHFSDWGLVVNAGIPGLYGPFTLNQAVPDAGPSFQASGNATLFYQANDATRTLYLSTGSVTVPAQIPDAGLTCTPLTTQSTTQATVAEIWTSAPVQFRWSINGSWQLSCTDPLNPGAPPVPAFMTAVFDTLGVNLVGCTRGYDTTQPLAVGTDHVQGTYVIDCGARGKVTGAWNLVQCVPGVACTGTQACYAAVISCDTGNPVCTDTTTPLAAGTDCGTGHVCDGAGTCIACAQGQDCTPAGACVQSQVQCATGAPVCTPTTTPVAGGTSCGAGMVCDGTGTCIACVQGQDCTPAGACVQSQIQCGTGAPVCTPTTAPVAAGTSCGAGQVCDGAGACIACVQGQDCTPAGACFTSQIQCGSGAPVCTATTTPVAAGTTCGTGLVCNGAGGCIACVQGQDCTPANACFTSQIQCTTGAPVCTPTTTPVAAGTSCGAGQVCNGAGGCVACVQGQDCTPAGACVQSQIQCGTGTPVCTPTATPVAAGTSCGTGLVCNGAGGCIACVQDQDCTPAGACFQSRIQCGTGAPVCTATTTPVTGGTSCGSGLVCDGAGACVQCLQGQDCTPAGACVQSQIQCGTGAPVCTATATPVAAGTSCGTGLECNGAGACLCVPGLACASTTNPCLNASITCDITGTLATCTDGAPKPDGASCGPDLNCSSGVCTCVAGSSCPPSDACHTGAVSCDASNNPTCVQTQLPDGTACGTLLNCSAGVCTCVPDAPCPPIDQCHTGAIACDALNNPSCVQTPVPDGTPCVNGSGVATTCVNGTCP